MLRKLKLSSTAESILETDELQCEHGFDHVYGGQHVCDGCCSVVYEKQGSRETLKDLKSQLTLIQDNPIVENLNGVEIAEIIIQSIDRKLEEN